MTVPKPLNLAVRIFISDKFVPRSLKLQKLHKGALATTTATTGRKIGFAEPLIFVKTKVKSDGGFDFTFDAGQTYSQMYNSFICIFVLSKGDVKFVITLTLSLTNVKGKIKSGRFCLFL